MTQILLFPDPRPLVERLGPDFFRGAPTAPGVYLMRDHAGEVLYVGKAKNLRKRLANYRVANPDRVPTRHLRLLRAVERIELRPCDSELAALANESALLRTLRPRYNRAGTWPATQYYFAWRSSDHALELAVLATADSAWRYHGPLTKGAYYVRATLARLFWCAFYPETGVAGLPEGWFEGRHGEVSAVPLPGVSHSDLSPLLAQVDNFFAGSPAGLFEWILDHTAAWTHPFDLAVRAADLETLTQFITQRQRSEPWSI